MLNVQAVLMTLFTATLVWQHACKVTPITQKNPTHTPWLEPPEDASNVGGKIII